MEGAKSGWKGRAAVMFPYALGGESLKVLRMDNGFSIGVPFESTRAIA